jgi:hypothetical protein
MIYSLLPAKGISLAFMKFHNPGRSTVDIDPLRSIDFSVIIIDSQGIHTGNLFMDNSL